MGRSDSEHSIAAHETAELAAKDWAEQLFRESETDAREICSVEYTLLIDGRSDENDLWDEPTQCNDETGDPWTYLERQAVSKLKDVKLAELYEAKRVETARKAAMAEAERQAAAQAKKLAADKKERAEFLRLQAKFGVTTNDP